MKFTLIKFTKIVLFCLPVFVQKRFTKGKSEIAGKHYIVTPFLMEQLIALLSGAISKNGEIVLIVIIQSKLNLKQKK
jgi:hypothetical protein